MLVRRSYHVEFIVIFSRLMSIHDNENETTTIATSVLLAGVGCIKDV
jgi:hypothetical protein